MASMLVVGGDGLQGRDLVAGAQDLAHPLEVLVDQHPHHLDLEGQLLQLRAVLVAERAAVSRIGR